jgi:hypothetical protein
MIEIDRLTPPSRIRAAGALALATLLAAGGCSLPRAARGPAPDLEGGAARIAADVAVLADDAMEGRGAGTAGNDSAAAFIARRFASLGLRPIDGSGFLLPFTAHAVALGHGSEPAGIDGHNVAAIVPGTDASQRGRWVVVGAHFDHLGRSPRSSLDPQAQDAIRNGADDNASGTAVVLELARRLKRFPTKRPVALVLFDAEELGLLGSRDFVERPVLPLDSIEAMVNLDMVGRLRDDKLLVFGTGTATELSALADSANLPAGAGALQLAKVPDGLGPSDHASFARKGVPVLHLFTDVHEDYHRATDDVAKLDAAGAVRRAHRPPPGRRARAPDEDADDGGRAPPRDTVHRLASLARQHARHGRGRARRAARRRQPRLAGGRGGPAGGRRHRRVRRHRGHRPPGLLRPAVRAQAGRRRAGDGDARCRAADREGHAARARRPVNRFPFPTSR